MTDIFDIFLLETVLNGVLLGGVLALLALGLNLVFGVIDELPPGATAVYVGEVEGTKAGPARVQVEVREEQLKQPLRDELVQDGEDGKVMVPARDADGLVDIAGGAAGGPVRPEVFHDGRFELTEHAREPFAVASKRARRRGSIAIGDSAWHERSGRGGGLLCSMRHEDWMTVPIAQAGRRMERARDAGTHERRSRCCAAART